MLIAPCIYSDISPIASVDVGAENGESGETKSKGPVGGGEPTPISLRHVSIEARKVLRDLQLPTKLEGASKQGPGRSALLSSVICVHVHL